MILSGDGQTIVANIYAKYYNLMVHNASQILGVDRAEDAVHDALIKLMKRYEKNIELLADKPRQFFVIVVRNYSIDMLKKEHLKTVPFEDEFLNSEHRLSSAGNPEDAVLHSESAERLADLIEKLTPATKKVLEYRFIEGYSNKEIAKMLKKSQSVISTRIEDSKKRLKALLENEVAENGDQ